MLSAWISEHLVKYTVRSGLVVAIRGVLWLLGLKPVIIGLLLIFVVVVLWTLWWHNPDYASGRSRVERVLTLIAFAFLYVFFFSLYFYPQWWGL